jgi:hypothetical protein
MPSLKVPGCDKTFSQCPQAEVFVLANYRTMSIRDLTVATTVAYHNVAEFLRRRGLMADRYTLKRRNIEQAKKLSTPELAYLAGIIDGEGTITLSVREKYAQPVVTISNTSYLLRDWMTARGFTANMTLNTNKRWYWRLGWTGYALDQFLPLVRPYLVIKARHSDLLMEFISLRRAQSKSERPTDRMREIVLQIRWLNERMLPCSERERRDMSSISSLSTMSTPSAG